MEVTILSEGTEAVEIILRDQPDIVVLDLMLPGKDGLTICREVRATSNDQSSWKQRKSRKFDRLLGLELGADDYLCKPFSPRELVARVKAILRRTASPSRPCFSRNQFLDLAFPFDADVIDRTIDSHIRNIRTKIKNIASVEDPIRSVHGVGYTFGD